MTAGLFVAFSSSLRAKRRNPSHRGNTVDCFVASLFAMTLEGPSLQKALRVDVDLELEIAFGLRTGGEPLAQIFRQIDAACRLHQQPETITALDHRERGFGRSQYLDPLVDRRDRG